MERIFETIIVGAGPGGLTAGRYLEDALILDKKEEIGKPVQCAEGLARKFLDHFNIQADPAWALTAIDNTQIILPNGKIINMRGKEEGYVLDRINFEKFLASQSQAEIKLQKRVIDIEKKGDIWQVKTESGEIFRSKYLIGADGPLSIVRRKVFPEEKVAYYPALDYLVEVEKEVDCSTIKIYFDKEKFPFGYAWIFPKGKNLANIGLGLEGKDLNERFRDFMEKTVKKELGNYRLLKNISGVIPWGERPIKIVKDNVLLVGDAGAMVDPISGGGIGNAMMAGEQAAKAILDRDISSYPERIKFLSSRIEDIFSAQKIFYSFDNQTLNEIGEILEMVGGDIFYLKNFFAFANFLKKPNLRKNIFQFLRLFFIYQKWRKSQTIIL